MQESQRDIGLVRAVGTWALAANIVSIVIGAGIFAAPGALAACVGSFAPLAFLACGVAVAAVAICFADAGSRYATSGGVYGPIAAAFGPLTGYVAGTLLWVGDVLSCGSIAAALADVAVNLFSASMATTVRMTVIIGVVGGIALINAGGVQRGTRLVSTTTWLKLIPLAIFVIAGLGAVHASNFIPPAHLDSQQLGRALILAVFAFVGMETALCTSGEVRQPNRTIPRALGIAMATIIVLYIAVQTVAQGILGPTLAASKAPLADAMGRVSPALRAIVLCGAVLSMLGWLASDILGSPRQLFAFGRDGLLPSSLGRLHRRSQAPHIAIYSYAALAMVLALTGSFAELAVLSTLPIAALYIMGCAAAWVLARRGEARAGKPLNFRFIGAAAAIGIGGMLAVIGLSSRAEMLGLAVLIGSSALAYSARTRFTRKR